MRKLPEEIRETAVLYFFQELKQREIAKLLHITQRYDFATSFNKLKTDETDKNAFETDKMEIETSDIFFWTRNPN